MKPALILLAYAAAVAVLVPRVLQKASWPERAPRLAVVAWQASTASILLAVVLAGATLSVPAAPLSGGLAELLHACSAAISSLYASPAETGAGLAGLGLVAAVLARSAFAVLVTVVVLRRRRRAHREQLAVLSRPTSFGDVVVVDDERAAAYCLPGRSAQVVLTASAMAALDPGQLAAVLAHERAHLRARHHWVLAAADAGVRAFPLLPFFRVSRRQIGQLIEMQADDVACRSADRLDVAAALITLGRGNAPKVALAAHGGSAAERVRRLLHPPKPLGLPTVFGAALGSLLVVALPVAVALAPALSLAYHELCPIASHMALIHL